MDREKLLGKRIGILGFGINNLALTRWLLKHGAREITICDRNPTLRQAYPTWKGRVTWQLGPDYLNHLTDFQIIFRTPGIPYLSRPIQAAKRAGVEISSQTKLFFELSPAKIIGVTGTKGKGTTATLIAEILRQQFSCGRSNVECRRSSVRGHRHVYLAGNIGKDPFEFLDQLRPKDWMVLELSSFQLQDIDKSPHIAVVLRTTVDHLDHHKTRAEYVAAKLTIAAHQQSSDRLVLHLDCLDSYRFAEVSPAEVWYFSRAQSVDQGTFVRWSRGDGERSGDVILRTKSGIDHSIGRTDDYQLRGEHNLENITAAATAAYLAGARLAIIRLVTKNFRGLPHRLELVGHYQGRSFYNDSFATNPEPVMAAVHSFAEPIHLIVGGSSKGADFKELGRVMVTNSTVASIIPLGTDEGPRIAAAVDAVRQGSKPQIYPPAATMAEAVAWAMRVSQSGDVIVLSPGAASFDLFTSYKERGDAFRRAVSALGAKL